MNKVGQRKVRSDKKRDVKPTVPIKIKNVLRNISKLTNTPIKNVSECMTILVIKDRQSIEYLSQYFKRDFRFQSSELYGSMENENTFNNQRWGKEKTERVTIRFSQQEYEMLARLSYALDCTISRTVATLLQIATQNMSIVNAFVKQYLQAELDERQMRELRGVLSYANSTSDSHHSWASLLALVKEEIGNPLLNIKETVGEFLNRKWS